MAAALQMNADAIEQALREFFARDPHGTAAVYLLDEIPSKVCVLLKKNLPRPLEDIAATLQAKIEDLFETSVDVLILDTASLESCIHVFREGKVIVDQDRSARLRFEVATRKEYWDFLPILQRYRGTAR